MFVNFLKGIYFLNLGSQNMKLWKICHAQVKKLKRHTAVFQATSPTKHRTDFFFLYKFLIDHQL